MNLTAQSVIHVQVLQIVKQCILKSLSHQCAVYNSAGGDCILIQF